MKYLLRSLKYFLRLSVVLAVILFVLVKLGFADGNISTMFVHGYDSLWQIAAIVAVLSLAYPRFGYVSRSVLLQGETCEVRPTVDRLMETKGYRLKSQDGENLVFVKNSPLGRLMRFYDDAVSFTRTISGYDVEGRSKDIVRIVGALENIS